MSPLFGSVSVFVGYLIDFVDYFGANLLFKKKIVDRFDKSCLTRLVQWIGLRADT
jgi:hypothetical protein